MPDTAPVTLDDILFSTVLGATQVGELVTQALPDSAKAKLVESYAAGTGYPVLEISLPPGSATVRVLWRSPDGETVEISRSIVSGPPAGPAN